MEDDETGDPSRRDEGSKSAYGVPFASKGDSEKPRFMPVGVRGTEPLAGCPGNWKKLLPLGVGELA